MFSSEEGNKPVSQQQPSAAGQRSQSTTSAQAVSLVGRRGASEQCQCTGLCGAHKGQSFLIFWEHSLLGNLKERNTQLLLTGRFISATSTFSPASGTPTKELCTEKLPCSKKWVCSLPVPSSLSSSESLDTFRKRKEVARSTFRFTLGQKA